MGKNIVFEHDFNSIVSLWEIGPLLPAVWSLPLSMQQERAANGLPPDVSVAGHLLIDTGSNVLGIDSDVASALGLCSVGPTEVYDAGSPKAKDVETFAARVTLLGVRNDAQVAHTMEQDATEVFVQNDEPIMFAGEPTFIVGVIGRDFLKRCDFRYNGPNGKYKLSWPWGGK